MTPDEAAASRAVLIGVPSYQHLGTLEGVRHNVPALYELLTAEDIGGLSEPHCIAVPADSTPGAVLDAIQDAAAEAQHLLIVYYAGHGHFASGGRNLLLATHASHPQRSYHSVPYEEIRSLVANSRAKYRIVIIDCCFSGLALHMDGQVEEAGVPSFEIEGACVLTSAAATQRSLCLPEGSVFTLELASLLQGGLEGALPDGRRGEDQPHLTMADVFDALRSRLNGRTVEGHTIPLPRMSTQDNGHRIPLALNRAYKPPVGNPLQGQISLSGERLESAWIVRHVLYVLFGSAQSIFVEDFNTASGRGLAFRFRKDEREEVHHLASSYPEVNSWTITTLQQAGIWSHARTEVEAGRLFRLVSKLPTLSVSELSDRAREFCDLSDFISAGIAGTLKDSFDQLASQAVFGSADTAWRVLRGFYVSHPDELDVERANLALADLLLDGPSGDFAVAALVDLVRDNIGLQLDRSVIQSRLNQYGLRRGSQSRTEHFPEKIKSITSAWAANVERELLTPVIQRDEASQLLELLGGPSQLLLLTGTAGGGKSATLQQSLGSLDASKTPVLAFRLDRLDQFSNTRELGERIGLDVSPVTALAFAAGEGTGILLVDQVDAISLASGRMPKNFDAVANLVSEAEAFPRLRIVLVCRLFDIENDYRLRQLVSDKRCARVEVGDLTDQQVTAAIESMGLNATRLNDDQKKLLRSPLNLVLLHNIRNDNDALSFQTTKQLFDSFWRRKLTDCVQRRGSVRFHKVVSKVADSISERQRLSVPYSVLDADDLAVDADVLVSEHVLVRDGQQVAFFHESFFDYTFARGWIDRSDSLVNFLLRSEQELFRRAQVRQILNHMREVEPERFVSDVESLLMHPAVRFHVKDVVLSLIPGLADPSPQEWEMVDRVLASRPKFANRLRRALRTAPWFSRADNEGLIEEWLAGPSSEAQSLALEMMAGAGTVNPDRIAEILGSQKSSPDYPSRLRWIAQVVDIHASRAFFELVLEAVRQNVYAGHESTLWLSVHGLAERQASWTVELLHAFLSERAGAMDLNDTGKVKALLDRDHSINQLVEVSAVQAPEKFCDLLVPYILRVVALTAKKAEKDRPILDRQFSYRYPNALKVELEDTLLTGAVSAIRSIVERAPQAADRVLRMLAGDPHETAQWLLYKGLSAAGERYAQWSAELLLESTNRLISGYPLNNSLWGTHELLEATSSFMPNDAFSSAEERILSVRFPWGDARATDRRRFTLLSAMQEDRLSEKGRRRLNELRRRFGAEKPDAPRGIVGGFIGPPISVEASERMNDAQWMRAIEKYHDDRRNWESHTGGAHEQAGVLKEKTKQDPERFARLALQFTESTNPAYSDAILMGLGEAAPLANPIPAFAAVRHIASLGRPSNDRWLGTGVQKYLQELPEDLIEVLLDRALNASDPLDGSLVVRTENNSRNTGSDIWTSGFNTVRGSAAQALGDILIYDADGSRSAIIVPHLRQLATDRAVTVRSCVAHLLHASMRHARREAMEAFSVLIQSDDELLATRPMVQLMVYIGRDDPGVVHPVVERMLISGNYEVRQMGGQLSVIAAAWWEDPDLLESVLRVGDVANRKGAAELVAHELVAIPESPLIWDAYARFTHDSESEVRQAAASLAAACRGSKMRSIREPIERLIESPAFEHAATQLFISLRDAPDRVDDLVLMAAGRFMDVSGRDSSDIRTGAAADARYLGELIIRAYAQASAVSVRSKALDILDNLLLLDAFGISELIVKAER
ncbi:caspase, EACC1-associated type [Streptomyces olivaceus]